jgi:hypothetical protein
VRGLPFTSFPQQKELMAAMSWKVGRGKLGPLLPMLGDWVAETSTPMGPARITRSLRPVLGKGWLESRVVWQFGERSYEERAFYGITREGELAFWSITSDGKQSHGVRVDAPDLPAGAIAFQAEMPAGTARMSFWPDPHEGFRWAVESRNRKGCNRFSEHHYLPAQPGG